MKTKEKGKIRSKDGRLKEVKLKEEMKEEREREIENKEERLKKVKRSRK
jgi:hypothetical protein